MEVVSLQASAVARRREVGYTLVHHHLRTTLSPSVAAVARRREVVVARARCRVDGWYRHTRKIRQNFQL